MNTASNSYGNDAFNSYAKGFLKPFKGKGELIRLRDELEDSARVARQEAIDMASQANGGLLKSTDLWLTPWGKSGIPARTLQWRDNKQRSMGLWLLETFLSRDDISEAMRQSVIDLARMLHRAGQTLPDLRLGEDIGATGLRLAIS